MSGAARETGREPRSWLRPGNSPGQRALPPCPCASWPPGSGCGRRPCTPISRRRMIFTMPCTPRGCGSSPRSWAAARPAAPHRRPCGIVPGSSSAPPCRTRSVSSCCSSGPYQPSSRQRNRWPSAWRAWHRPATWPRPPDCAASGHSTCSWRPCADWSGCRSPTSPAATGGSALSMRRWTSWSPITPGRPEALQRPGNGAARRSYQAAASYAG